MYALIRSRPVLDTPAVFSARDEFNQGTASLAGQTLPVGGTWAGAGDADDFSIVSSGVATRTAQSDAGTGFQTGRFGLAGTGTLTNTLVKADVSTAEGSTALWVGVVARYTDTSNWLLATLFPNAGYWEVRVVMSVAGVQTNLFGSATAALAVSAGAWEASAFRSLSLEVLSTGVWRLWSAVQGGEPQIVGVGSNSALATGGGLASGRVGIYDYHTLAKVNTRTFDNFAAWVPVVDHALYSGQSATLKHNAYLRENAAGTSSGKLPIEGSYLRIPPSTRAGRTSRIVIKRRRYDNDGGMPDTGLSDTMTATLTITPRVLLTGRQTP